MKNYTFYLFAFLVLCTGSAFGQAEEVKTILAQKSITITAVPVNAEIFHIRNIGSGEDKLGTGTAQLKLDKDEKYIIEVRREGYQPVRRIYMRQKNGSEQDKIELLYRVVDINASPSDAKIFVDNVERGNSYYKAYVPKGQSITVDVKKPGFLTLTKVYYNKEGQDEPEASHLFKLEDRLLSLKTVPIDASITVDGKKYGEGNTDIVIKKNTCVSVTVERLGFVGVSATYCNKDNEKVPPMTDELVLNDRTAQFNTQPDDAKIIVDGKEVGKGAYLARVPRGKCVEVAIERSGYARERYELCNKPDYSQPESSYPIKLTEDEAYTKSEEGGDKANRNFSVEVNPAIPAVEAWKKITSIIQTFFDEIENSDFTTSYLRTNWVASEKLNESKKRVDPQIIRTRVIISSGGSTPLRYNVMIQSERSKITCNEGTNTPPVNKDDCFETFPRILRKYNDLIQEIQRRLQ